MELEKKTSNNHELCFPHFDRMGRQINTNIRDLLRLTATEMTSHLFVTSVILFEDIMQKGWDSFKVRPGKASYSIQTKTFHVPY